MRARGASSDGSFSHSIIRLAVRSCEKLRFLSGPWLNGGTCVGNKAGQRLLLGLEHDSVWQPVGSKQDEQAAARVQL
jgi:hypothetical protein